MRNRLRPLALPLLGALLLLAGCAPGDSSPTGEETNDSDYQRGLQLEKRDRPQEALAAYLKVIARRGEENAPESHLEAGVILLQHNKDPIPAIYHFQKYLESRPSPPKTKADLVRQQIDAAKRDFARSLRPQPLETAGDRQQLQDQIARLQSENDRLTAELAAMKSSAPVARPSASPAGSAGAAASDGPRISLAPVANDSPISLAPLKSATPAGVSPVQSAPLKTVPQPAAAKAPASGRKHTVQAGDTLYKIAQHYYGSAGASARADAIYQANRDVMKTKSDLKPGMELKLP
jgi:LysM repeat protein